MTQRQISSFFVGSPPLLPAAARFEKPRIVSKGFNWFVQSFRLYALIRGWQNLGVPLKGFNCCGAKMSLRWAESRFAKPRSFPERERVYSFCVVQKVTKKHARTCKKLPVASFCASETAETGRIANGREQGDHVSRRLRFANLWTPGTIQIAGRYGVFAKMTGVHQVTGFAKSCNFAGYRRQ